MSPVGSQVSFGISESVNSEESQENFTKSIKDFQSLHLSSVKMAKKMNKLLRSDERRMKVMNEKFSYQREHYL